MPDAPDPIGPLYSQAQLAKMLDPTGEVGITARSIRTEIEAGRLKAVKFAGKLCIRPEDALERLGGVQCQSETRDSGGHQHGTNDHDLNAVREKMALRANDAG